MIKVPTHREPTHPGEMLLEEFSIPMELSQKELADAIHVPSKYIDRIINRQREITPSTALRLTKFFNVSGDFWLNIQLRWNLYHVRELEAEVLEQIQTRSK